MKPKHIIAMAAMVAAAGLTACSSDLDKVFALGGDDITLGGASEQVILSPDTPNALVLTLYWNGDGRLTLSDTLVQAPINASEQTIQLSATEDFSAPMDITVDKGVRTHQFLSEEFNSLLGRMNYKENVLAPLYIRINDKLASNVEPRHSNTLRVDVQPYRVHLDRAAVLTKDHGETAMTLYSPTENGVYTGFMGVAGWENWFLLEANKVEWGNLGVDGKPFYTSSDDSKWNFWFPGPAGCYYTTVNTREGWWSALHIDQLTVSGDVSGEMTFNKAALQWTLPVERTAAGTATITIKGDAHLYDRETGTDDDKAKAQTVGFGGQATQLTFAQTAEAVTVELPQGKSALVLDLSDPAKWTIKAGEAAPEPQTAQQLYFSGLVTWDGFDDYLTLYDEGSLCYGGAHYINSEWGYRAYTEQAWNPAYKAADGATAMEGSMVLAESDGNIPAPEKGLYVMDFNMKDLTYKLTAIDHVTYAGLNDDWTEKPMTQDADNPEVFTAEFQKTKETPWGVKVLINGDWSLFFGGGKGTLRLGKGDATTGFDGDNDLEVGKTYILTVDLGHQTYSYKEK